MSPGQLYEVQNEIKIPNTKNKIQNGTYKMIAEHKNTI